MLSINPPINIYTEFASSAKLWGVNTRSNAWIKSTQDKDEGMSSVISIIFTRQPGQETMELKIKSGTIPILYNKGHPGMNKLKDLFYVDKNYHNVDISGYPG